MDGLLGSVGNGITSLVSTAFAIIGGALRGIVAGIDNALPGGWAFVLVFALLFGGAWVLAKR